MTEEDVLLLIKQDEWMMRVIGIAADLNLPDWIIGAGFVRNKVWNYLHGYPSEKYRTDVDLVYFDPCGNDYEKDKMLSKKIQQETGIDYEVVNQAYTHVWRNMAPNVSSEHSISTWSDTATCVGVTKNDNVLSLVAPHGIKDLVELIVRPNPTVSGDLENFRKRVEEKRWLEKWPKLKLMF